ncbi:beta-galactosidase [Parafilimonas sp.]|uniref:beta-galactosidase n=1 Tax=Parafilimonas sp. TaxID=1969739 RepID=UPI0039E25AFE
MRILFYLSILTGICMQAYSQSNDHIFPAAETAKKYIDFDQKGFIIYGRRTFIVSAGLEYARVPRGLWKDRLLRLKMAGFNCVEIYTFWNYHEPREGKFDFSGDHDLNAFLQLVHSLGMYCIARIGPYYCAEWNFGGYPIWLRFKENLKVREPNAVFEKCVDHFFDTLMHIVFRNQVNHGGPVIMVQLENEHPLGWGTAIPNVYFEHLKFYALDKGLEVPYFFSGLHHDSDPAGENYKLDDAARPNPWFSTEFWSGWFNRYGSNEDDAKLYARRTWKIIAGGGGGYNYYMAYGGSNFEYDNNDEDAASYDNATGIGQAGDLRPMYFAMKRAALFARSFEQVLADAVDATGQYAALLNDTSVVIKARSSAKGDIVFLDNRAAAGRQVNISGKTIWLEGNEIYPLIHRFALSKNVMIDWAFSRVYAVYNQGNTTNIILSGKGGEEAAINFSVNKKIESIPKEKSIKVIDGKVCFSGLFPLGEVPVSYSFNCDGQTIRIICISGKLADHTWFLNNEQGNHIVIGPSYASGIKADKDSSIIFTEQPWDSKRSTAWLLTEKNITRMQPRYIMRPHPAATALSWQYKPAFQASEKDFMDGNWLKADNPLQMGADGDITASAWYRANIVVPEDTIYTLQVDGNGRATAYIDGRVASAWLVQDGFTTMHIPKGNHSLSVFVAHNGRDKLAAYIGPVDSTDSKGLFGEARLIQGVHSFLTLQNWQYRLATAKTDVDSMPIDVDGWLPYTIGQDVFNKKKGFAWFRTLLPAGEISKGSGMLFFRSVDENATVFINHQPVAHHEGWNQKFYVTLNKLDTIRGSVYLNVFIENYDNEGGIDQPVLIKPIPAGAIPLTGWKMKGGTGDEWSQEWAALNDTLRQKGPCFYKAHFTIDANENDGIIRRVSTTGLGHGSVWINGHNIGRYPEKIPAPGMYIPECWLKEGDNTLAIYDEDGRAPVQVQVITEALASRDFIQYTAHNH